MPDTRFELFPANESSASDEESKLEIYLQKQLEEDVARIFDESIYSDLEIVCGKLKVLTHSCILKARTHKFYHKLQTILHVNIERCTFDELYSFLSDVYTECDIKNQEREIIKYLKSNYLCLNKEKPSFSKDDDTEVYLTPKCISPYAETNLLKIDAISPSTELTKEYYALVPIEGNLLDQELSEQDALSDAFHSIIKTQKKDTPNSQKVQHIKPTTLSLKSSHTSKIVKHSTSCDIINSFRSEGVNVVNSKNNHDDFIWSDKIQVKGQEVLSKDYIFKEISVDNKTDRTFNSTCSPDSLITDDPSSSSDYLSAALNFSPGLNSTEFFPQSNVGDHFAKMNKLFTSSDSGLENTGLLESLTSHKDVTTTDVSLTESTLHESVTDDNNTSIDGAYNTYSDLDRSKQQDCITEASSRSLTPSKRDPDNGYQNGKSSKQKDVNYSKSSKEEKQRQNEEIVTLESSSVSSETGSWESIFPPKGSDKEICEKFLNNERTVIDQALFKNVSSKNSEKINIKTTPCFIDASNLVDEELSIKIKNEKYHNMESITTASRPLPCPTTNKSDISPNDWSESNENDDSLEQPINNDLDLIQKDLSPTIFEMTPITEDSLCTNAFETAVQEQNNDKPVAENKESANVISDSDALSYGSTVYLVSTPHNSILSLTTSSIKSMDNNDPTQENFECKEEHANSAIYKYVELSPVVSDRHTIEKTSVGDNTVNNSKKDTNSSSWMLNMTSIPHETDKSVNSYFAKKPGDKACEILRNDSKDQNDSKSRSSIDSDSSEKSSHKFYIDLSSLPDPLPPQKTNDSESLHEKKNIFSMYIDLGEKGPIKEMPARLASSLNVKKQVDKNPKVCKNTKKVNDNTHASAPKINEEELYKSLVFEEIESLCNDPNISIHEIIGTSVNPKTTKSVENDEKDVLQEKRLSRSANIECRKHNTITVIHEESTHKSSGDLFVKLSDLDKPVQQSDVMVHLENENNTIDVRMTRSIPDNNWGKKNQASRSIDVLSSFHSENALSLNRLFPHLKNEFSKSMPGSLFARTRSPFRSGIIPSPGETEEHASDVSELSSVQSSMCRSVVENSTTEDTSQTSSLLIGNCQSRLGQDLLRMFLEEIAPDVIVEVSGKRIKAHKCILSSRCQYFAGILSGGWVESAGNVIVLPPFSFNVVHFALCHIYSGLSTIPDFISIVELATIADMLGLEGLKEAIMFTLKAKYCHHFHRPCVVCTAGVLECFPLSSVYGLDDLYRKCLRWITKYFSKVWPTKAFATLPKELLDKCYQEHVVNLSTENLIETVCGCGITVASLQKSRWAETVARMCRRLINAAAYFAAFRLSRILEMIATVPTDTLPPAKKALSDCITTAIEWAPPDETCRAYAYLSNVVKEIRNQNYKSDLGNENGNSLDPNNLLYIHSGSWRLLCEGTLVRAAPRVVGTQAFKDLPQDLRKRLRELGCIMYGPQAVPITSSPLQDRKSRSVHQTKSTRRNTQSLNTQSLDMEQVRSSFVPYKAKPTVLGPDKFKSNSELRDKKSKTVPPKVRTTKAQEERTKFNQTKTNQSQDRTKSVPRLHTFENTKPRYLEPRPCKEEKKLQQKKLINKMVSSSESSRNSSPVLMKNLRNTEKSKDPKAMSQDSLVSRPRTAEPLTDSLSESQNSNKYATYTKTKHTCRGSVESVRTTKNGASSMLNSKTKIPVYLNQNSVQNNYEIRDPSKRRSAPLTSSNNQSSSPKPKPKNHIRNIPGSLMNATKASSAKMVTKVVKEPNKNNKKTSAKKQPKDEPANISAMGRSGTFLKDEPTFGEKTTNIDIDQ